MRGIDCAKQSRWDDIATLSSGHPDFLPSCNRQRCQENQKAYEIGKGVVNEASF